MAGFTSPGLGKTMQEKLCSVGVCSTEELKKIGSKEALFRLKIKYPSTCVVILYHLEAAVQGTEIKMLSPETKQDLQQFFKKL